MENLLKSSRSLGIKEIKITQNIKDFNQNAYLLKKTKWFKHKNKKTFKKTLKIKNRSFKKKSSIYNRYYKGRFYIIDEFHNFL